MPVFIFSVSSCRDFINFPTLRDTSGCKNSVGVLVSVDALRSKQLVPMQD